MRRMMNAAVLAGVALLCVPAVAQAQQTKTFRAGPVKYLVSKWDLNASASQAVSTLCEGNERVSAGGFWAGGPIGRVAVASSYPLDLVDPDTDHDDGWHSLLYNSGSGTVKARYAAVCLRAGFKPQALAYDSSSHNVPASPVGVLYEPLCSGGRVVGGGVQLGGANDVKRLSASGPFSAQGSQQRPDDGWRMRASTTGPATNVAHSICLQTNALAFRYPRKEVVLHGGQARKIVVRRPKKKGWRVVGGGARECSWTSRARSPGTARTRARPPTTAGWCAPALRTWRPSPWS